MKMGHGISNKESDECLTPKYAILPLLKYISEHFNILKIQINKLKEAKK